MLTARLSLAKLLIFHALTDDCPINLQHDMYVLFARDVYSTERRKLESACPNY